MAPNSAHRKPAAATAVANPPPPPAPSGHTGTPLRARLERTGPESAFPFDLGHTRKLQRRRRMVDPSGGGATMQFVPALLLSPARCLPTTALSKGGHGGSSRASHSHVTHTSFSVPRNSHGKIKRSSSARASLQHQYPCPATGRTSGACQGYAVDHVVSLKRRRADHPSNNHWQIKEWT